MSFNGVVFNVAWIVDVEEVECETCLSRRVADLSLFSSSPVLDGSCGSLRLNIHSIPCLWSLIREYMYILNWWKAYIVAWLAHIHAINCLTTCPSFTDQGHSHFPRIMRGSWYILVVDVFWECNLHQFFFYHEAKKHGLAPFEINGVFNNKAFIFGIILRGRICECKLEIHQLWNKMRYIRSQKWKEVAIVQGKKLTTYSYPLFWTMAMLYNQVVEKIDAIFLWYKFITPFLAFQNPSTNGEPPQHKNSLC